ncbi:hypothetical protein [Roseomonas sp. USHLN139]|uniref:hypothetical protein n=1 Tax=Roseomonas sp. USHLN139 TaxID=3081298 RepID=UPI003B02AB29
MFMRQIRMLGGRFLAVWRDEPSWAEFFSAIAVLLYVCGLIWPGDRPYELKSLQNLTDLLPGWWWPTVCASGALYQMAGALLRVRFIRASAGFGMCMWYGFMVVMVWPVLPGHPMVLLSGAWIVPNFFIVARHAKGW